MESSKQNIFIVGAGINTPSHLSLESVATLQSCEEVWTNLPEAVHSTLPGILPSTIRSLRDFLPDRPRMKNYISITEHILERASTCSRLRYLTQGHPLIFDSVAAALIKQGPAKGIAVTVQPGISSIDTVLVDLVYDPAKGLQVYEATTFVQNSIAVDTRGALLLLQPSVFGSKMPRLTAFGPGPDLSPLMAALKKFYPDDHKVQFVRSASATMNANILEATVGTMTSVPANATLASSLFIPPMPGKDTLVTSEPRPRGSIH